MPKRFCPNCGSSWVEPDSSNRAYIAYGGGSNKWECNDCNYVGWMPEGDPEETDQDLDFEPGEDYPREDLDFGTGYLKFLGYIVIPSLLLYITYLSIT